MNDLTNTKNENEVEKPEVYEAPAIEIIEVEIEQGFQASGPSRRNPAW